MMIAHMHATVQPLVLTADPSPPTFYPQGIIDPHNLASWPIVKGIVTAPIIPPPTFPSHQGIIDLRNLARWPIVKDIVSAPVISQLLQAVLPTLALMVFLAIVPWLLR